eukprot:Sspe_Gene.6269::Locus_2122_Transcript_1_1_Confidence_1.000_Length_1349::g.6269::m.6269
MQGAVLLLLVAAVGATTVWRVENATAPLLRAISRVPCSSCNKDDGLVDVWYPDGDVAEGWVGRMDVRGDMELKKALGTLEGVTIMHTDVEAVIDEERQRLGKRNPSPALNSTDDFYTDYHTYTEMEQRMHMLAAAHGGVEVVTIGYTYQGQSVSGIRFGSSPHKHIMYMQCGIHAREWIAPITCLYVVQKLLESQQTDPAVRAVLAATEVVVIPCLNRDGYDYTWSTNRLWRKNRQPNAGSTAVGTDLNRNFDSNWGGCGTSNNPASDTYRGTAAWSCPESEMVRGYLAELKNAGYQVLGAHDIHSYGNLIMRPFGYTTTPPPNDAVERTRGASIVDAIRRTTGQTYTNQRGIDLYCTSGTSRDWLVGQTTESSTFTYELRGTPGGFILPPDQIVGSGEEIFAAVLTYLQAITYRM